ncbi:serine/threonine-protein kinase [Rathayibacter sp. YIM 133350]|uniref:serine/threonine-protein kinase n=1 Tax=Rathayibacter sp. YIM 133350 TaxID=3131992 RepID=UPI00307E41AB
MMSAGAQQPQGVETVTLAGRYEIRSIIARGGMGSVYYGWDTTLARAVAVKVIPAGVTADEQLRSEREIAIASHARHPGFVEVFDAGDAVWNDVASRYLVMGYVDGESLHAELAEGPLDLETVAEIGAQVADALAHLHGRDLLHLDVKPGNILIEPVPTLGFSCRARVIDFGIARPSDSSSREANGELFASAAYMSPEQVADEPLSGGSDMYSLGLVLLRAITGVEEYTGTKVEAAVARLHRDPAVPSWLPQQWRDLLAAMTARDPQLRPTAHDVAAELTGMLHRAHVQSEPRHATRTSSRTGTRPGSRPAGILSFLQRDLPLVSRRIA